MTPSPANYFVRANYLACVVFAPVLSALPAAFVLKESPVDGLIFLLPFAIFALLSGRAIRRLVATRHVLPPELVSERQVVGFVVTLFGGAGHFFFFITMSAAIGIALAPEWPEEAKKIVFPLVLGMLFYGVALLCGELALAGNGESDRTRASGSGAH